MHLRDLEKLGVSVKKAELCDARRLHNARGLSCETTEMLACSVFAGGKNLTMCVRLRTCVFTELWQPIF